MSTTLPTLERVAGIEPASSAWKAEVLPLNYTRYTRNQVVFESVQAQIRRKPFPSAGLTLHNHTQVIEFLHTMVEGGGFEPPKLSRQIYSLIPLATREPLRKAAYCPDAQPACQQASPNKIINLRTLRKPVLREPGARLKSTQHAPGRQAETN